MKNFVLIIIYFNYVNYKIDEIFFYALAIIIFTIYLLEKVTKFSIYLPINFSCPKKYIKPMY